MKCMNCGKEISYSDYMVGYCDKTSNGYHQVEKSEKRVVTHEDLMDRR